MSLMYTGVTEDAVGNFDPHDSLPRQVKPCAFLRVLISSFSPHTYSQQVSARRRSARPLRASSCVLAGPRHLFADVHFGLGFAMDT